MQSKKFTLDAQVPPTWLVKPMQVIEIKAALDTPGSLIKDSYRCKRLEDLAVVHMLQIDGPPAPRPEQGISFGFL